jgi:hypothetical protein
MKRKDLWGGAKFCEQHTWEVNFAEHVGRGAAITLAIDASPMYGLLNHPDAWDGTTREAVEQFDDLVERCGFYYEFGYAWSLHFYRLEPKLEIVSHVGATVTKA